MFRYYLSFIFGALALLLLLSSLVGGIAPLWALGALALAFFACVAIDAIIAALVRLIPAKAFNPQKPPFRVLPGERRFCVKLGIRRWKDKIPETGGLLCHFSKKEIAARHDNRYLLQFIAETCYAELMHLISIPAGFLICLAAPLFDFPYLSWFALPVAAVNAVLQLLPALVQRYVRPFLLHAYAYNERKQKSDGQ